MQNLKRIEEGQGSENMERVSSFFTFIPRRHGNRAGRELTEEATRYCNLAVLRTTREITSYVSIGWETSRRKQAPFRSMYPPWSTVFPKLELNGLPELAWLTTAPHLLFRYSHRRDSS